MAFAPDSKPIRRAKPMTFAFDLDAAELLKVLSPNSKGLGFLVSELIRKEARERAERPALLAKLAALAADGD